MALAKTVAQCPYRITRDVAPITFPVVEERWDFQIKENGQLDRVCLGEFDIIKEVDSHKDEVGLINCLKMAEARGINPSTFAKTEPGLMADVGDIDTLDDLIKAKASADAKLDQIAKAYGLTREQLLTMVQSGKIPQEPKVDEPKEGDAE